MQAQVTFQDWGHIEYGLSLEKQLALVEAVAAGVSPEVIIFCSHPAIVTLGRKTQPGDVFAWQGPMQEVSRGGRATYHGPSQLVIYPIISLERAHESRPYHDIGKLLRRFENAIVAALAEFRIEAQGKSYQKKTEQQFSEETGVWVGNRKIASLGLAVKNWVTYHGAAINLDQDPAAFQGMNPCGFSSDVMTSMEEILGQKIDRSLLINRLKLNLSQL